MAEVSIANVRKVYGSTEVIHDLSVKVNDGEFVVLVGPSGCGKSTLLRMVAGLESITAGEISIGGKIVNNLPPSERDIAMVFQNYALYPHKTVEANMAFSLKMRKLEKNVIKDKISTAAEVLGLTPYLKRYPRALSGGQRQRVAMGRAIVRDPQVFLFDEPLSNLDAKLRVQMRAEIRELHQRLKSTTLYVTHDQIEALTFADEVVVMHEGQIVQTGTPVELFEKPKHTFVGHFIGSPGMNILPCEIANGQINFEGKIIPSNNIFKKTNFSKTQLGIRPEFIKFSNDGIKVKIKRVSDTGRHKVIDTECSSGSIKILANASTEIPSDNAHITFEQKYTYVYGDDWIVE